MHTYRHDPTDTTMHYNSDLSGMVQVERFGKQMSIPGAMLIEFMGKVVRHERIAALEQMTARAVLGLSYPRSPHMVEGYPAQTASPNDAAPEPKVEPSPEIEMPLIEFLGLPVVERDVHGQATLPFRHREMSEGVWYIGIADGQRWRTGKAKILNVDTRPVAYAAHASRTEQDAPAPPPDPASSLPEQEISQAEFEYLRVCKAPHYVGQRWRELVDGIWCLGRVRNFGEGPGEGVIYTRAKIVTPTSPL